MSLKKILITGSNGQLAHSINITFSNNSFKILNVSLHLGSNTDFDLDLTIESNVADLLNKFEPDFIINCAAFSNVDLCESQKDIAHKTNVLLVSHLLKYMHKNSKLLHISTDYIFDGTKPPYSEEDIPNPLNYYGKTKLEVENIIRGSRKKYIILRTGNLFSEFIELSSNRLHWIFNKLKNQEPILAATDMISKPTYTGAIANILLKILFLNQNLIINYSGQDSLSIYDFSLLVANEFSFDKGLINSCKMNDLCLKAKRPENVSLKSDLISELINCNIYETEYSLKIIKNIMS